MDVQNPPFREYLYAPGTEEDERARERSLIPGSMPSEERVETSFRFSKACGAPLPPVMLVTSQERFHAYECGRCVSQGGTKISRYPKYVSEGAGALALAI